MWVYADDITHEGGLMPRVGDIAIVSTTEFGETERKIGVVVETEGDGVDLMLLALDPDDFAFYV